MSRPSPLPARAVPPFVVTGMPRSGTTYSAAVLSRLGIDCGHEQVFYPQLTAFSGWGRFDGDASWLAVPFLPDLPADVRVVHLTRHPILVAGSLMGTRFLEPVPTRDDLSDRVQAHVKWRARRALAARGHVDPATLSPRPLSVFRAFIRRNCPEIWQEPTPIERALRFWVAWNDRVLDALPRFDRTFALRIEDFDHEHLRALTSFLGLEISEDHATLALTKVPAGLNHRTHLASTWSQVPDGPARDDVLRLCERLGYDPSANVTTAGGTPQ